MADVNTIWITGYAPTGHRISLTLAVNPDALQADITRLLAAIAAAGVSANEQPARDGRDEPIDAVVLRAYTGNDGKQKRVLDFYGGGKFKVTSVYIDSEALARDFEAVSGLSIDKLLVHNMKSPLERQEAESMGRLAKFAQPAIALLSPNPDYNPDAATPLERGARYKFAGWQGVAPAQAINLSIEDDEWTKARARAWAEAAAAAGIDNPLKFLGLDSKLSEWKGGTKAAYDKLEQYKRDQEVAF